MDSKPKTPAEIAVEQARKLLVPHFSAFVLITREDDENNKYTDLKITIEGGYFNAIGMMEYARHDLATDTSDDREEEEDDFAP